MSRSRLRNRWMQRLYANAGRSFADNKMQNNNRNPHRLDEVPKNSPSRYIISHCGAWVEWLQESTSYGGHSIPKSGHRRVSGLVRAKVRNEIRKQILEDLNQ